MPYYEYKCAQGHAFDVVKRIAEIDREERCECGELGERQLALPAPVHASAADWNRVEYNPGLGQWTKSWKHGRQIAKARGLEEVGSTPTDQIHKEAEQKRAAIRDQHYADAARMKV